MTRTPCPAITVFSFLSRRWTMLVLRTICDGTQTFNAIKRELRTISSRTLSERLKELENFNMIQRTIVSEKPLKIEYELTEKALSLKPHLKKIDDWARDWESR
ncbi:MAG: winged helix-turn-helix transcriptional regulator [Candidatus Altimarinota bacterium]